VFERLGHLSKHFDKKTEANCLGMSLKRNAELHSGGLCLRRRSARPQRSRLDQGHGTSDRRMGRASNNGGIPLERGSALHDPGPGLHLRCGGHTPTACHGHPGQAYCTGLTLAEWLCRAADRIDPARMCGPHHCPGRGTSAV
jgi:hypothetical protein